MYILSHNFLIAFQDPQKAKARLMIQRAMEAIKQGKLSTEDAGKQRKRTEGGGRKAKVPEIRVAIFQWFIDVRTALKGRISLKFFQWKCKQLHQAHIEYKEQEGETVTDEERNLKFSRTWVYSWMQQYRVSLKRPNKRYALPQAVRKDRIVQFLKNIWRLRHYFLKRHGIEPVIWGGDQMPLHRSEQTSRTTMNFTGVETYVKEDYMLSRERVTVYTQMSSQADAPAPAPEFVFKGMGQRVKLNPPPGVHIQWSPSASYRLEHMKQTLSHLPKVVGPMDRMMGNSSQKYRIYLLDNYSVHLDPSFAEALYNSGWILVLIGGGITGDIQTNDTALHRPLKALYREKEEQLMYKKLREDRNKIPKPSRDEIMMMMTEAYNESSPDHTQAFKSNWISNKLDGTEDMYVSQSLRDLVGEEMLAFRRELLQSEPPSSLREAVEQLTKPEGVRRRDHGTSGATYIPEDEGLELYDGDGQDIAAETEVEQEIDDQDEEQVQETETQRSTEGNLDEAEDRTAAQGEVTEVTEVQTDSTLQRRLAVLQKFADLLNKERSGLTSSEAGFQLISFFNNQQISISNARRKLLAETQLTRNEDLVEHLTQTACDQTTSQPEECPMEEETAQPEVIMEPEEPCRSIGDYLLIKCGESTNSMLPVCIVRISPLAVRYFTHGPSGLYSASEGDYDILPEDIVKTLEPPQHVKRGSRVYYKFDTMVWSTVHCCIWCKTLPYCFINCIILMIILFYSM